MAESIIDEPLFGIHCDSIDPSLNSEENSGKDTEGGFDSRYASNELEQARALLDQFEADRTLDSSGGTETMVREGDVYEPSEWSSWQLEQTDTGETRERDLVIAGKARIRDSVKDKSRRRKCDACHKTRRTVCWGGNTKKIIMIYCGKRKQPYKPKAVACSNCRQVKSKCDGD